MIGRAALFATVVVALALPASAQTALSTAGDVGSAVLRGGYPAAGGAAALPILGATGAGAGGATAASGAAGSAASPSSGASGGGRGGGSATGGRPQTAGSGGTHWVLCEPSGASGLEPLFTGTGLSCAPH